MFLFALLVRPAILSADAKQLRTFMKHDVKMPGQGLAFRYQKASYENITLILFAYGGDVVIAISRADLSLTPAII